MKRLVTALLIGAFAATPAIADQALAQKRNCLGCHNVDRKVIGPAYKDVAKKYAGQDVVAKLTNKIIKGGAGNWGAIPMPANPQVNQGDAEILVKWILSLK
jgi:cytochrome c